MSWMHWGERARKPLRKAHSQDRKRRRRAQPHLETLEDRTLFAIQVVSSIAPELITQGGSSTANHTSQVTDMHALSADGRYAVFSSLATNVVNGQTDSNNNHDVFLYDRLNGSKVLISKATGTAATAANGRSFNAVISGDGNYIAFVSTATNLIPNQSSTGGGSGVYLYHRPSGTLQLVTHTVGSTTQNANGSSSMVDYYLSISDNGQYVTYLSDATNLISGFTATGTIRNAYLYHRDTNTNYLVSHAAGSATTSGDSHTNYVTISGTGNKIALNSDASNLVVGQIDPLDSFYLERDFDIFVYDVATGGMSLVSHTADSAVTTARNVNLGFVEDLARPSLTDDGRYIAYAHPGDNIIFGQIDPQESYDIFRYDTQTGENILISHSFSSPYTAATVPTFGPLSAITPRPVISDSGDYIAYHTRATNLTSNTISYGVLDTNSNTFLWSASSNTNVLVSHTTSSLTTADTGVTPSMSSDGRYIVYTTRGEIRRYDRTDGSLVLISHALGQPTTVSGGVASLPTISADGTVVLFNSTATNLVANDLNTRQDVFISGPDQPPPNGGPTDILLSSNTVTAGRPTGTTIGTLTTVDTDTSATYTYTILTNTDRFRVTGNQLQTSQVFQISTQTTYQVTVRTTKNSTGQTFDKVFSIIVTPSTTPPTAIDLSSSTVSAGRAIGTTIGTLTTTDPNAEQTHTYTIISGGDRFKVEGNTLKTNVIFQDQTATNYQVTVRVTNTLGQTLDRVFTVTVTPSTTPPTAITLSNATVNAGRATGTTIGTLTTTDPNAGQTHTYTILSGGDRFRVEGDVLKTNIVFQNQTSASYQVTVRVTNTLGQTLDRVFTITVNPSTTPPTAITLSSATVSAGRAVGTTVGTLTTTDPNAEQTHTYTIISGGDRFVVEGNTLKTNVIFQNQTATNYQVTVRVTNTLGQTYDQVLTITVNPSTTPPTAITLSSATVSAGRAVGTTVGTLTTTDPNAGQTHTYTILSGGDRFVVEGNTLKTNVIFQNQTSASYQVTVRTTNTLGQTFDQVLTVTVNPSTTPPTAITLSNATVNAGRATGTTIGTLTTTDPNAGQTHTYTILSGGDRFRVEGDVLKTNIVFQNQTSASYQVTVRVTNTLGQTFDKVFTITVNPSTTPPTAITLSSATVSAGRAVGTTVGTLTTTDPNAEQTHTYTILSGGDRFVLEGNTLKTNVIFQNQTSASYQVTVRVTNTLGQTFDQVLTITVNPSTTPPTAITLSNATVSAGRAVGTTVGTLTTTDPNAGQTHTYTILSGGDRFVVEGNTLKTNVIFQNQTSASYQVTVRTTNTLGQTFDQVLTVTVNPSTTPPTAIDLSSATVSAGRAVGTTIGTLTTTDPNAGQTHTYTILSGGDRFVVEGNTLKTNVIFQNQTSASYQVTVRTTNTLGQTFDQVLTVTVNPSTTPPTAITLSNLTVTAGSVVGTAIGTLTTTDPNAGQTHTYTIISGGDRFVLDGNTLRTNVVFQNQTSASYQVTVRVTNTLGQTFDQILTITVNPSTTPPTNIVLSNNTLIAGQPAGTAVGLFTTVDPNAGQTHTYSLLVGGNLFAISGNTLWTNIVFPNQPATTYQVIVRSTNTLGQSIDRTFSILVTPSYIPSMDINLSGSVIHAGQAVGTAVGTLTTTHPDPSQTFTYTLVAGGSQFAIDGNQLETSVVFQNSVPVTTSVTIRATDLQGFSVDEVFVITIEPSVTPPTAITLSDNTIDSQDPAGTVVGTLATIDPNADQVHSYQILDSDLFTISGDQLVTTAEFDVTETTVFFVTVRSTNTLGQSIDEVFEITVVVGTDDDTDEDNIGPSLSSASSSALVSGNQSLVVTTIQQEEETPIPVDVLGKPAVVAETLVVQGAANQNVTPQTLIRTQAGFNLMVDPGGSEESSRPSESLAGREGGSTEGQPVRPASGETTPPPADNGGNTPQEVSLPEVIDPLAVPLMHVPAEAERVLDLVVRGEQEEPAVPVAVRDEVFQTRNEEESGWHLAVLAGAVLAAHGDRGRQSRRSTPPLPPS